MTIKCVLSANEQQKHYPESYLVNGVPQENPEIPERVNLLLDGAKKAAMEIVEPGNYGIDPIARVHDAQYLHFLELQLFLLYYQFVTIISLFYLWPVFLLMNDYSDL